MNLSSLLAALPLALVCAGVAWFAVWMWSQPWRLGRRRAALTARPFPSAWRKILRNRVPLYRRMPAELQRQLRGLIQVFIAEKPFIGCRGLQVTDEIRVTIAAQACLLQLNRRRAELFADCRQILVYPGAFVVDRVDPVGGGVMRDQRRAMLGESWSAGQVVLSWADSRDGAAVADDGQNVVIHEFAHQLDQANGVANGAPPLPSRARHDRWARVMAYEFDQLRARAAGGEPALFDFYGATEPAEFFAVASEVFFERPAPMAAGHPQLYAELAAYYRVDPVNW